MLAMEALMFEEILSRPAVNFPISIWTYFMVFGEALFLGLAVSWIYKRKKISYDRSFQYSLWLISPIVATLLLFIGSNLALSIGMIGSLSVIRFRTAIKDPLDLMYLFLLIMIGLGCGTQNYLITALSVVLMVLVLVLFVNNRDDHYEESVIILKDENPALLESALKDIREKYPKAVVSHLLLGSIVSDATVSHKSFDETWLFEFKKRFPLKTIQLVSK